MSAQIIQFDQTPTVLSSPTVRCSFCGVDTTNALSSGDNTKHICPKCMVKCDTLMKSDIK